MPKRRVLVIGWDAADWKVLGPMMEAGRMPALSRLVAGGVTGNLASLQPMYSPMLWTSIATGKRPYKHGIHGFSEADAVTGEIRPISGASRSCKAIWNILTQEGKRSMVVGWWPSHPAEPINGVMVSNHYQRSSGASIEEWPMGAGTVHPPEMAEVLAALRMHQADVGPEHVLPFVPRAAEVDQEKDRRLQSLAKIIADCGNVQAAATFLLRQEPWDFMGVYFDAIDHFGHGFMKYHPPRQEGISEEEFEMYRGVIEAGYRFHDMMLGVLLHLAGEDVTVVLVSDHGFHPDHLRPKELPMEPAGPAHEHRPYGIFLAHGPGIRRGGRVSGASLLDVCPTVLTMFGLPVGEDMDGRVLAEIFEKVPEVEMISSWESRSGESGMHGDSGSLDPASLRAGMDQLVALGYVEAPTGGKAEEVARTNRELDCNLAKAFADGERHEEALEIAEGLVKAWPEEYRFHLLKVESLVRLQRPVEAAGVIDEVLALRVRLAELNRVEFGRLQRRKARLEAVLKVSERRPERHERFQRRMKQCRKELRTAEAQARLPVGAMDVLRVRAAMLRQDREAVVALMGELPQADEGQSEVMQWRATLALRSGATEEAVRLFTAILERDPESRPAWHGLARAHARMRRWVEAEAAARRVVALAYKEPEAHYLIGAACAFQGRNDEACEALAEAVRLMPGFVRAFRLLARITRFHHPDPYFHTVFKARAAELTKQRRAMAGGRGSAVTDFDRSVFPEFPEAGDDGEAGEVITVVTGLPRSGTSLMMQMLVAGGMTPLSDAEREADESNPRGYYEYQPVMGMARDVSWMPLARGKVVKIVAPLLVHLPEADGEGKRYRYRVVFMNRDWREVHASQTRMIERRGQRGAMRSATGLKHVFAQQLQRVRAGLVARGIAAMDCDYGSLVRAPEAAAGRLGGFLKGIDVAAAAAAVDAGLYREKV